MNGESVLITDGEVHFAMAVLRSLGKQGIPITVASEDKEALAAYSRYCTNFVLYPSAKKNVAFFVNSLSEYVKRSKFEILIPLGDLTLWPISAARERFKPYVKFPFPSHSSIRRVFNKAETVKLAEEQDVPTPKTFHIRNISQLKRVSEKISYPAVIKPRFSWFWSRGKTTTRFNIRPEYVTSHRELLVKYLEIHEKCPFPMIQEYIPGQNYSVAVLCNDSKIKAYCFIKVHRAIPITGGNSTFRESVEPNFKMMRYVSKLMKALNWHGIAEVEFRLDERDFAPKFMEINARFWGSLQTAILAGVDFPYLLYKLATEGNVPAVNNYKIGVKNRWLSGDIQHLIGVLRSDYLVKKLIGRSKWQTFMEFLNFPGNKYDCLCPKDLVPFFISLKRWRMCYKNYKLTKG
ncbi:hypothetical protein DRO54_09520 [Candidatus Bathyarchaeota archaeon]|nr:MAG: hypothetical protein DRO54_09520 [Candidatus Bathyarchaeota archaeon]